MNKTPIEWCRNPDGSAGCTVNPLRARRKDGVASNFAGAAGGHYCEKTSPGCTNCYSSAMQHRFGMPPFGAGQYLKDVELFLDVGKLAQVIRHRKPTRIFWADMTDLFGAWVKDEWIAACLAVMAMTPQHTHMLLTKRADRMRAFFARLADDNGAGDELAALHALAGEYIGQVEDVLSGKSEYDGDEQTPLELECEEMLDLDWPLPNVWLGVSVEGAAQRLRLNDLLATPAAVHFASFEPLLEHVDARLWLGLACVGCGGGIPADIDDALSTIDQTLPCGCRYCTMCTGRRRHVDHDDDCSGPTRIDWGIIGLESGPSARDGHVSWVRGLLHQVQAAGVAAFVKQLGTKPHDLPDGSGGDDGVTRRVRLRDRKGGDPAEWSADLRVREWPAQGER